MLADDDVKLSKYLTPYALVLAVLCTGLALILLG